MKTKNFRQINAKDRDLSLIQGNVVNKFNDLDLCPFIGGNSIENITITNATNGIRIAHGLQTLPLGWIIVDKTGLGDVWRLSWDDRFIILKASVAALNLSIWVY